ncbi:MAG: hypothetical protein D6819_10295, partial [Gammaproteobacteria bacterium]
QGVLPVLLGLGYRAFSVDPVLIPILADIVAGTSLEEARELASKVCRCLESEEVRALLGLGSQGPWGLGIIPKG